MKLPKPHLYIQYVLDQMDLKQIDLVRAKCGTSSHVSEICNGKRQPTMRFIVKFLKITNREDMAYKFIESITREYKIA